MEQKLDAKSILRAYQHIVDNGTRTEDKYILGGLSAQADFDGYSVTLADREVTLRLLFHNNIDINTPNSNALKQFRDKLVAINRGASKT